MLGQTSTSQVTKHGHCRKTVTYTDSSVQDLFWLGLLLRLSLNCRHAVNACKHLQMISILYEAWQCLGKQAQACCPSMVIATTLQTLWCRIKLIWHCCMNKSMNMYAIRHLSWNLQASLRIPPALMRELDCCTVACILPGMQEDHSGWSAIATVPGLSPSMSVPAKIYR